MWKYEKKLQYPINIKNPNPKMAQIILSQYGGPDGGLIIWHAFGSYLSQYLNIPITAKNIIYFI